MVSSEDDSIVDLLEMARDICSSKLARNGEHAASCDFHRVYTGEKLEIEMMFASDGQVNNGFTRVKFGNEVVLERTLGGSPVYIAGAWQQDLRAVYRRVPVSY